MEDNVKRIAGEIASLKKTIIAREKVLAKLLKESGEPLRKEKLKSMVEYRYLKAGEIIEDGDEVEMSNTIHDPALWVPAANTVGQEAPDPAYVSHRKYRRLV